MVVLTTVLRYRVHCDEKLSVTEHVDDVINSYARSMYAIGVLRSHGSRSSSQSSSQSSRTLLRRGGADRQRIESFLRRIARSGLWESVTTAEELVGAAHEKLFWKLRQCRHHVPDELLPPESDTQHNLRKRRHNVTLPEQKGHLAAKNSFV